MKQFNNATVERVHDVRTLRACYWCDGLGNADSMIEGVEATDKGDKPIFWHGRCFIFVNGEAMFFKLARKQTDKLPLSDIGVRVMKKLLENR